MIIPERVKLGGKDFIKRISDSGVKIERDGRLYDVAYDLVEFDREYLETDIPIDLPISSFEQSIDE